VQVHAKLAGDDIGQRRLAQAGRTVEQDVVRRLLPLASGGEQDLEVLLDLRLTDVLGQAAWTKARLDRCLLERQRARCERAVPLIHWPRV